MGGSRSDRGSTYRNTLVAMALAGLWHGAAWTFVVWGIYHGLILIIQRALSGWSFWAAIPRVVRSVLSWIVTFHLVCFGWLIFRARDLNQVWSFIIRIATDFRVDLLSVDLFSYLLMFVIPLLTLESWAQNRDNPTEITGWWYGLGPVAVCALLLAIILLSPSQGGVFIYFQF